MAISTVMGRARSMRPSAIIRPLWSTTTAVTATSSCAAWACALRTIWIAFSPGIAIGSLVLPNGVGIMRLAHRRRNQPISRLRALARAGTVGPAEGREEADGQDHRHARSLRHLAPLPGSEPSRSAGGEASPDRLGW